MDQAIHPISGELTEIDLHLLHALGTGVSNTCIARHLGKSQFTVSNQLSSLLRKVNESNRTQAAGWYREYLARTVPAELRGSLGASVHCRPQKLPEEWQARKSRER